MARFSEKVALVTGSSSGIGKATAILLARQGCKVTITGRNTDRLEAVKREILKNGSSENDVLVIPADLIDESEQDKLIEETITEFGQLDILVNSVGGAIMDKEGKTGVMQGMDVFDKNIQLHLRSVVMMTKKAIPHLMKTKGEVVSVSAIGADHHGNPQFLYDSMPKAALNQFTRSAAVELIRHGIRVNSVSPGFVNTGFFMMDFMSSRKECIPYGAVAQPDQIVQVIAFLADRKMSSYIIGQSIVVDGGSSLIMGMEAHDMQELMGL
ncbi:LOW QUALITY PROTEIN: Protein CBG19985 [Caenorhabditis briggsae]|uniref:Protein CBG19985 n=1 Tax=Caenorhabditis briggsae TaxID=6238 RepID=A8XWV7_CAEBR|nr:LOW QUALITY PROTEIN: Protein CBG19985 [Caenorhabditis briggsae]CAP37126.1 Protein CBG19985 [Caenorhabditis briggsae]